jgi:hypothetical protein
MSAPLQSEFLNKLFLRLSTNGGIIALVPANKIFNHVPELEDKRVDKPYIHFMVAATGDFGAKNEIGYDNQIQIDIYSDARGDKEVLTIMDAVVAAVHNIPLVVTSGQDVLIQFDGSVVDTDADGILHHGILRFRSLSGQT